MEKQRTCPRTVFEPNDVEADFVEFLEISFARKVHRLANKYAFEN